MALRTFSPGSALDELDSAPLLATGAVALLAGALGALAVGMRFTTSLRYNVRALRRRRCNWQLHYRMRCSLGFGGLASRRARGRAKPLRRAAHGAAAALLARDAALTSRELPAPKHRLSLAARPRSQRFCLALSPRIT
jgi:hypothetical protein